jgi:regulator of sirC expression with transglutaminase-like and TPR domain
MREVGLQLLFDLKQNHGHRTEGRALLNALYILQCCHPAGVNVSLSRLHRIGEELRRTYPSFDSGSVSDKCRCLLETMTDEQFLAADQGDSYYDIDNSFLHAAFHGKPTIPLTLVSIFCALADECGLCARPIGFPGEVMAQVDDLTEPLIVSVFESKSFLCGRQR